MKPMIHVIIIEDEPISRETLTLMLQRHESDVAILDTCSSPAEGILSIRKHNPDLIFLDIQMPKMNGFEMLRQLQPLNFEVIFTTAFDQYAIDALRISALDYLLKPIDGEELSMAIHKMKELRTVKNSNQRLEHLLNNFSHPNPLDKTITISSVDGITFVKMSDILRLEANGRYTAFHLINGQKILVSRTLGDFEDILVTNQFFRIHDAHIINLNYLEKYHKGNNTVVLADKSELSVARRRKDEFLKLVPSY